GIGGLPIPVVIDLRLCYSQIARCYIRIKRYGTFGVVAPPSKPLGKTGQPTLSHQVLDRRSQSPGRCKLVIELNSRIGIRERLIKIFLTESPLTEVFGLQVRLIGFRIGSAGIRRNRPAIASQ